MTIDVIDYLEKDHLAVLEIIEKLENSSKSAVTLREELFHKVRTELALHETVEEKILYPQLEKADKSCICEAYEEHALIDKILQELSEISVTEASWMAKLNVMKENLTHHINEERQKIFPLAQKLFDQAALRHMAHQMQQMKEDLKQSAIKRPAS